MKKLLGVAAVFFLVAALGSAATLCTSFSGPQVVNATFSCSLGGLTFSNFLVIAAAGQSPEVDLVSANIAGGSVNLNFNPNMSVPTGNQDLFLFYTVKGGVTSVGGANAGANATIQETVCMIAFDTNHLCAAGSQLANFTIFSSGTASQPISTANTSVNIFKDVQVTAPGSLTSFTQSFGSNGAGGGSGEQVPEPVSFLLMGSGLVALSLLKKVRNA